MKMSGNKWHVRKNVHIVLFLCEKKESQEKKISCETKVNFCSEEE